MNLLSRVDIQNLICLVENEMEYLENEKDMDYEYYIEEIDYHKELLEKLQTLLKKV